MDGLLMGRLKKKKNLQSASSLLTFFRISFSSRSQNKKQRHLQGHSGKMLASLGERIG